MPPAASSHAEGNAVLGLLLARGQVRAGDLERAAELARGSGASLEAVLSRLGLVGDADMATAMAEALQVPYAEPAQFPAQPPLAERLALSFLRHACVLPLRDDVAGLDVAMADPRDDFTVNALRLMVQKPVRRFVAPRGAIERALDRLGEAAAPLVAASIMPGKAADRDMLADAASGAPAVAYVQKLLGAAVRLAASDIHLEPGDSRLEIRFRLDGRLLRQPDPPADLAAAIIGRIKVLAGLDIAENRLPQDGRVRHSVDGREIDIRVATLPALHGEAVALRLLDRGHLRQDIAALGFDAGLSAGLEKLVQKPHGILLVTGPTGSGKTTTLYGLLARLNRSDVKILTVEDPVEFRLDGINQIQVRPGIGLDFARVLRAFLRHDPDILMVGEIRDGETARIAIQAALTGHLILSTLHTNDAVGAIPRLLDMGVEPYLLSATLNGVLAQRLVRRLCPDCARPVAVDGRAAAVFAAAGLPAPDHLHEAAGCPACHGTGYRGRLAIGELLLVDDAIAALIDRRADAAELLAAARRAGMGSLRGNGLALAASGATALDEVLRATSGR